MNELIKVSEVNGKQAVSARELYLFLTNDLDGKNVVQWLTRNILENSLANQNYDYQIIRYRNESNREIMDVSLTIDFAKELCMLSQCAKGKQARLYFIECEKQLKQANQFNLPQTFSQALQLAADQAKQIELQQSQIKELEPKAEVFEHISNSNNLLTLNDAAKSIGIGRNKLMNDLRERSILRKNNTPYQTYIDLGYFEVKVKPIKIGNSDTNYIQTFVTGKGLTWLSKFCKDI